VAEQQKPRKPKGWHSRRHESATSSVEAREHYFAERGPAARKERAKLRSIATVDHKRTKAHRLGRCACEVPNRKNKKRK
jgi:hypothetical protein